jgi:hypothetical protein
MAVIIQQSPGQSYKLETSVGGTVETSVGGTVETSVGGTVETSVGGTVETSVGGTVETSVGGTGTLHYQYGADRTNKLKFFFV